LDYIKEKEELIDDMELVKKVGEIDVIIGGHTHQFVDTTVNQVRIVRLPESGTHVGKIKITKQN
jgi:2',3'-cyclic-nucleotide 2'-phosphodiesterase (5'-nucleotidase family)